MAKSNWQKMKMLYLQELLWQESDEEHPLTTRQLIARLAERGISCDRRTLSKDMEDLNEFGYEVLSKMCGHEKGYYVEDRHFSMPELRILMDAVQGAGFISKRKTAALTDKIAVMAGTHRADLLRRNCVAFNPRKHKNEMIYYTIDVLERALTEKTWISFMYFDLDVGGRRVYRKNGARYLAEPVSMVLEGDRYYLMAVSPDRPGITTYRIDRMEQVRGEPKRLTAAATRARSRVANYTGQAFKMFAGPVKRVTLEFNREAIGSVYDHFGEDVKITEVGEGLYRITAEVQVSPGFWGWLLQFGGNLRIIAPASVVKQTEDFIASLPYGKQ